MDCQSKIKELRECTGMNRREFCEFFEIPYQTVTDWERGARHAPDYLIRLLEYYILTEKVRTAKDNKAQSGKESAPAAGNNKAQSGKESVPAAGNSKAQSGKESVPAAGNNKAQSGKESAPAAGNSASQSGKDGKVSNKKKEGAR